MSNPIEVECPRCGARQGERCVASAPDGWTWMQDFHAARWRALNGDFQPEPGTLAAIFTAEGDEGVPECNLGEGDGSEP